MADNEDALDAIKDIIEAIEEFGSTLTIQTITEGVYDPYAGPSETITTELTKGIIKTEATQSVADSFLAENSSNSYDLAIKIYSETEITKANRILYDSIVHEVVFVSKKVLQDTTIIYEVLVRR